MFNVSLFNQPLYNLDSPPSMNHYIFMGSYRTASQRLNHIIVVGRDTDDNFVYGEATTSSEIDLVGERLDFKLLPQVRTIAEAEAVATAQLSHERMNSRQGFITLPPNCGVELWDVITVHDDMSLEVEVDFRVVGITFVFNATLGSFYQKLFLCGL
jgi:hypothetical protein